MTVKMSKKPVSMVAKRPMFPRFLIATRPWSFPAALSPLLITFTILFLSSNIILHKAVLFTVGIVALQGAANLLNSFCDFENGLDQPETAGDRTMVDALVTRKEFPFLFLSVVGIWFLSFVSTLPVASAVFTSYLFVYVAGLTLAVLYSAGSPPLKYIGFGDFVVFMAFGPLLVIAASWACAIDASAVDMNRILLVAAPASILVVAILHANNHRDLKVDAKNSAKTISVRLGAQLSKVYYDFLVLSPALLSLVVALWSSEDRGMLGGALILPLSLRLCSLVKSESVPREIDAETAKVMLMYGLLTSAGIAIVGL